MMGKWKYNAVGMTHARQYNRNKMLTPDVFIVISL